MDVIRLLQLAMALVLGILIGFYGLRATSELVQLLSVALGAGALGAIIVALWRWDNWA